MKVSVDTNVLVRAVVSDDPRQAKVATELLKKADVIAVALPCLCELSFSSQGQSARLL